MFLTFI